MKLVIKLAVVMLVAAVFLPMWLKGPDGEPIMEPGDWFKLPTHLNELRSRLTSALDNSADIMMPSPLDESDDTVTTTTPSGQFYRWQDEQGVWHFSDKPPEQGASVRAESLPEVANSMQAIEVPEEKPRDTVALPAMDSTMSGPVTLPEGVSKEAIEGMLQDAHERRMGEHL